METGAFGAEEGNGEGEGGISTGKGTADMEELPCQVQVQNGKVSLVS